MTVKDFTGSNFYVYEHRRASDGLPFYVGKGKGRRAWRQTDRTEWWKNVCAKHGVEVVIVKDGMSNSCAITLERITIAAYLAKGYPLVNLTLGGEGAPGAIRTEESKISGSRSLGGRAVFSSDGMRFETAVLAAEWLQANGWPKASRVNISGTCLGKVGSAYGRTWWYEGDEPKEYIPHYDRLSITRSKTVLCSNGMIFRNVHEAGQWMHSQGRGRHAEKQIWKCLNGKVGSAHGLIWKYEAE